MIAKVKQKIKNNKKIVENFSYLSLLQLFNMLLPLVTYPYLMKILGADVFGKVIFAQVLVAYFAILINFGFNVSATRNISIQRDNLIELSKIVSSVYFIKTILFILSFFIFISVVYFVPYLYKDRLLYLYTFGICLNEWLFPTWYFQGIEKMKFITILVVLSKVVFFPFIFIFVKKEADYLYVPFFYSLGAMFSGVLGVFFVIRHKVRFTYEARKLKYYFLESLPVFFNDFMITVKDRTNVLLIGSFIGTGEVAIYDFVMKIGSVISALVMTIRNAIFPNIFRTRNISFLKGITLLTFIFILIIYLFINAFMFDLLRYFFDNNVDVYQYEIVLRVLFVVPIISCLLIFITVPLLVHKYYKDILKVTIHIFIVYLIGVGIIYLLGINTNLKIFVYFYLFILLSELIYKYVLCKMKKIL